MQNNYSDYFKSIIDDYNILNNYNITYINTEFQKTQTYINIPRESEIKCLLFDHIPLYNQFTKNSITYELISWNIGSYTQFFTWKKSNKYNNLFDMIFINRPNNTYTRFNYNLSVFNEDNYNQFINELNILNDSLNIYYIYVEKKSNIIQYILEKYIKSNLILCLQEVDNYQNNFWLEKILYNDLNQKLIEINRYNTNHFNLSDIKKINNLVDLIDILLNRLKKIINNDTEINTASNIIISLCKKYNLKIVNNKYKTLMLLSNNLYEIGFSNNVITSSHKKEKYFIQKLNDIYEEVNSDENKCIGHLVTFNNGLKILNLHCSILPLTFNIIFTYYREKYNIDDNNLEIDLTNIDIICGDLNQPYSTFMSSYYSNVILYHPIYKDYDIIAVNNSLINNSTHLSLLVGGNISKKNKYLKYKIKYLKLLNKIN
jgi:hypothetical protein